MDGISGGAVEVLADVVEGLVSGVLCVMGKLGREELEVVDLSELGVGRTGTLVVVGDFWIGAE